MTKSTMSTQTTNQLKNGDLIRITAEHFPAAAREACAARLVTPDLSLEAANDMVRMSIAGIARVMHTVNKQLEQAEHDYASEQADDPPARKRRDEASSDLGQRWGEVKSQLSRRFGPATTREYGMEGELPTQPDALAKQTANAIKLLRAKPRTHASKLGEFTTVGAADYLEEAQEALSSALTHVTTETKELQNALGLRDAAATDWRKVYQACATLLEGYLRLGGRSDLADRVRPTIRRSAGLDPAPLEPAPAPDPSPSLSEQPPSAG